VARWGWAQIRPTYFSAVIQTCSLPSAFAASGSGGGSRGGWRARCRRQFQRGGGHTARSRRCFIFGRRGITVWGVAHYRTWSRSSARAKRLIQEAAYRQAHRRRVAAPVKNKTSDVSRRMIRFLQSSRKSWPASIIELRRLSATDDRSRGSHVKRLRYQGSVASELGPTAWPRNLNGDRCLPAKLAVKLALRFHEWHQCQAHTRVSPRCGCAGVWGVGRAPQHAWDETEGPTVEKRREAGFGTSCEIRVRPSRAKTRSASERPAFTCTLRAASLQAERIGAESANRNHFRKR